jgi:hypothetical protein
MPHEVIYEAVFYPFTLTLAHNTVGLWSITELPIEFTTYPTGDTASRGAVTLLSQLLR